MCNYVGDMYIDVNGNKGPNVLGRDVFEFYISDEGVLYPNGGKDYALYNRQTDLASNSFYWKNNDTSKAGSLATGRLVEEGWKMNY
jgi:hypothetical protein